MRWPRKSAGTNRRRRASFAVSRRTWAMAAMSRRRRKISVTDGNKIKVHRIVAATDPGVAVNPAQIERQIAGSFVYGLTGLFYGGCTVKDGRIEQTNFDTYNSMRIAEMPKVESILMPSGGSGAASANRPSASRDRRVLNAYFAATGKRIRSVPLRDQNITFA